MWHKCDTDGVEKTLQTNTNRHLRLLKLSMLLLEHNPNPISLFKTAILDKVTLFALMLKHTLSCKYLFCSD